MQASPSGSWQTFRLNSGPPKELLTLGEDLATLVDALETERGAILAPDVVEMA